MKPGPILIAGPTASGKSAYALDLAGRLADSRGGTVINADSMQVYAELRILTARPSRDEEARAPHLLYGHVSIREAYSVGRWLADVQAALAEVAASGRVPIVTGGTGLYFKALTEGLAANEITRVIAGEPLNRGDDDDTGAAPGGKDDKPSLTAIPKTKPRKGGGGMEPEPSA